jgi:hypothetical protein
MAKNPQLREHARQAAAKRSAASTVTADSTSAAPRKISPLGAILVLLLLFAAAPFFGLTTGVSGLISLLIIFIGLRQAWRLTGRSQILLMGPYESSPAQ